MTIGLRPAARSAAARKRNVAQRLHEARDQRGGRVVHQPLDHLGDVHVGLVADRQEARDAEAAAAEVTEDQSAVRRLRDDRDATGQPRQIPASAVEPHGLGVDAHALA
jgi:hypothetical protein